MKTEVWKLFFQLYLSTHEMGTMLLRFKHDIALIILVWTYFIELIQKGRKICFLPTTIKIYGTYIRFKNQTTKLNIGNTEGKGLQLRFWRIGKLRTANANSWIQLMRKWTDNLNYYGSGIFLEKTEIILRLNNCKNAIWHRRKKVWKVYHFIVWASQLVNI